jgi:SPP1 family predicted phage head-tail adaptor
MQPVQSGKMRNRVQFQRRSTTRDAANQPIDTWTTYYTAWASIEVLRSQMNYQTADFISESTYKMELRYPGAAMQVGPADRAVCGDTYVIDAVVNTERRNRKLEILCHILNEVN